MKALRTGSEIRGRKGKSKEKERECEKERAKACVFSVIVSVVTVRVTWKGATRPIEAIEASFSHRGILPACRKPLRLRMATTRETEEAREREREKELARARGTVRVMREKAREKNKVRERKEEKGRVNGMAKGIGKMREREKAVVPWIGHRTPRVQAVPLSHPFVQTSEM